MKVPVTPDEWKEYRIQQLKDVAKDFAEAAAAKINNPFGLTWATGYLCTALKWAELALDEERS
jgi:hypothetical protein